MMYRLMSDLGSKAGKGIRGYLDRIYRHVTGGRLGGEVDLGVALNAFMARDRHEVDTMNNFLES